MRQLPQVYSQRDPRWAGTRLGTASGATIGQFGCSLTSLAMVACYNGHQVTPLELNAAFLRAGVYVDGDLCADNDLQQVFSDCRLVETKSYAARRADLRELCDLLSDERTSVILELDFDHDPTDGIQTHFVTAVACDGATVTIADPWYGGVDTFATHYGRDPATTIQKFVVYAGSETPAPRATAGDAAGGEQVMLDRLSLDAGTVTIDDAALQRYLEQLGTPVNMDSALVRRACLAYRRGESRGPAVSDEYPATAPDGRAVVRQRFSAGIAEYDSATGQATWVEVVLHPE